MATYPAGGATLPRNPAGSLTAARVTALAWPCAAAAGVAALLSALCIAYAKHFPHLSTVNDIWFSTDVQRHVDWVVQWSSSARFHLHPLSFVLFKAWGSILRFSDWSFDADSPLIVFAWPAIALTSIGLVTAASWLVPRGSHVIFLRTAMLLMLVLVGPIVTFGPMPESHVPGGVLLLLQAVAVWKVVATSPAATGAQARSWIWLAVLCGGFATGFSVSNVMPASIIFLALKPWRRIQRAHLGAAIMIAALGAALLMGYLLSSGALRVVLDAVAFETNWLQPPSANSVRWSVDYLVLSHFGVPPTQLITFLNPFSRMMVTSVQILDATWLHVAAFALWCAGVFFWLSRPNARSSERRFVGWDVVAACSLVVFHSVYDSDKAYMFAPHLWPYLVLPGTLAWLHGVRERRFAAVACITAATLASAAQTGRGLEGLRALPSVTGQHAPDVRSQSRVETVDGHVAQNAPGEAGMARAGKVR
jgi:hypothetical protein